jgi:[ribosomal protein S5]-alanine N-acetyltransferase
VVSVTGPLETARLRLVPHEPGHLLALIEGVRQYERRSGMNAAEGLRDFIVSDEVSPTYLAQLRTATSVDPWVHGFAIVHQETQAVVGTAGFKGPPTAEGTVEIGYGVVRSYQGQGLATEAAEALVAFARGSDSVRLVRAHTLPESNASTRVLEKCGFTFVGEVVDPEDGIVWRWERSP